MPVVRGEQIELEILRALVGHVLAVDHHAQAERPLRDDELMLESGHVRGHDLPVPALGGELLEGSQLQ